MKRAELVERIQAVLDGVATPSQVRELEQRLAVDASARVEFEQWQRLFVALGRVPQASPPEGLVAAVTSTADAHAEIFRVRDQLLNRRVVIGYKRLAGRGAASGFRSIFRRSDRLDSTGERDIMSEQQRIGFGNRKLWAGGAVMVLAVGVAMIAFDLPPKSSDVVGTIAPAERYRAPQSGAEAVQLGQPATAQTSTAGTDISAAATADKADAAAKADKADTAGLKAEKADAAGLKAEKADAAGLKAEKADAAGLKAEKADAAGIKAEKADAAGLKAEKADAAGLKAEKADAAGLKAGKATSN
jgi:hypothetical protein